MRAIERPPGCPVALARVAQDGGVGFLHLHRGHALQIRFERALDRKAGGRKRRLRIAHSPLGRDTGKRGDDLRPCRGNRGAGLGHDELETLEAGVIAHAVGEQAVALLHGALEVANARAVAGVEAEDEAVEETPALGGGAGEEPVERRRHPDELDVLGEHAGTAGGGAVDAHDAGAALALRRRRQ